METFVVGGTTSDGHLFLCLLCGEVYTSGVGKCLGLSPVISITLLRASKANNPILSNFFFYKVKNVMINISPFKFVFLYSSLYLLFKYLDDFFYSTVIYYWTTKVISH